MHKNINRFLIISLLIFMQVQTVLACRFNVRETGFVDLGNEGYYLVAYVDEQTSAEIIKGFMEITNEMLPGSNIEFELVNISKDKNHPAINYLEDGVEENLPLALLISSEGRSWALETGMTKGTFRNSLRENIEQILSSPFRKKLKNQLIQNYGVVLLLEGSDKKANLQAIRDAKSAVTTVAKKMDLMPKAIKGSPQLMVLNYNDRSQDPILYWTLGLEQNRMNKPHAAIFYGRSRWLGPLFRGEEITRKNLSEILFVVGADCECGIDKNWLRGTMLPQRWDKKAQADIAENLGFDPENPMIKIEVSRIMKTEHYPHTQGVPVPGIAEKPDSTDAPREGIDYDAEPGKKDPGPEPSEGADGSILPKSVIFTAGFLVLLLIVGVIIILRRSSRKL